MILRIEPFGKEIEAKRGERVLEVLMRAGIIIKAWCGGEGVCKACKIEILKGRYDYEGEESGNLFLACKVKILGDLVIRIPEETILETIEEDKSLLAEKFYSFSSVILKEEGLESKNKIVKDIYVELASPSLKNQTPDFERLKHYLKIKNLDVDLYTLKKLPLVMREGEYKFYATLCMCGDRRWRVIDVNKCKKRCLGGVLDIGTTTLELEIIDLDKNLSLLKVKSFNKQLIFGADVISRIIYSEEHGVEKLKETLVEEINFMLECSYRKLGINKDEVRCLICTGNTTMLHSLLGLELSNIRKSPFIPVIINYPHLRARELGINIFEDGLIYLINSCASFLGSDIIAGLLEIDILHKEKPILFIDLGTNGEIVLGNREWLIGCSCSCGPCFEGSGQVHGTYARKGGIIDIEILDSKIYVETIEGAHPIGIVGTGYINIVYKLLKEKYLDKKGRFREKAHHFLVESDNFGKGFLIYSNGDFKLCIYEQDIENLKRAKSAIFAGIKTLLKEVDLNLEGIEKVFIAGAFGENLNIENSIKIGLLPDIDREKFILLGNSALKGTRKVLLDADKIEELKRISERLTYYELADNSLFMNEYIAGLFFPHTEEKLFTSVDY